MRTDGSLDFATICTTLGLWLLTMLGANTSHLTMSFYLFVLGAGMGMVMQITVLATQNAVSPSDMGTATSAIICFRSLGAVFGTALFGAIFVNRFNAWVSRLLPHHQSGTRIHASTSGLNIPPQDVHLLPVAVRHAVTESMVRSLHAVYWVAVPFALVAIVLALSLREIRLRGTSGLSADVTSTGVASKGPVVERIGGEVTDESGNQTTPDAIAPTVLADSGRPSSPTGS